MGNENKQIDRKYQFDRTLFLLKLFNLVVNILLIYLVSTGTRFNTIIKFSYVQIGWFDSKRTLTGQLFPISEVFICIFHFSYLNWNKISPKIYANRNSSLGSIQGKCVKYF